MRADDIYGARKQRHQAILLMSADDLHKAFPWTARLAFNQTMTKAQLNEKKIKESAPESSTIVADKDGVEHRWIVGNEAGEGLR